MSFVIKVIIMMMFLCKRNGTNEDERLSDKLIINCIIFSSSKYKYYFLAINTSL